MNAYRVVLSFVHNLAHGDVPELAFEVKTVKSNACGIEYCQQLNFLVDIDSAKKRLTFSLRLFTMQTS
jgi:hypothetical protein